MDNLVSLVTFFVGLSFGAFILWLIYRTKIKVEYERARSESEADLATLTERLAGKELQIQELREDLERELVQTEQLQAENTTNVSRLSAMQARLEEERRAAQEKLALLDDAQQKLGDSFKALSADALRNNNQSFLELAKANLEKVQETARGDLEVRKNAIDELVKPLKESLEKVDDRIGQIERARTAAYSTLTEQVRSLAATQSELQRETANLVKALRAPNVRGKWGEIQLKRVVEIAGMIEYCDFVQQETINTDEGRLRPDLTIRLPGGRTIVVDSKVPLQSYLDALETRDEDVRLAKLKDHARQIRVHLTKLGAKSYWDQFEQSPEFVFLFLPGETFFSAALEQDPSLIEFGVDQRVVLATPTTLIALLKAVSYGWRQEQMAKNAVDVGRLGKDLYDRLRVFTNYFADIGKNLDRALDAYNKGVGSFEARVLVAARKFKEHGALGGEEIDTQEPIDKTARPLRLDEGGLFPEAVAAVEPEELLDDAPPLFSLTAAAGDD